MDYDYYEVARALADRLEAEGQGTWAEKLKRAMADGATGTEIFMRLRWQLQQLKDCDDLLSDGTKEQIDTLLEALNNALR